MTGAVIGRNRAEADAREDAIAERRDDPDFDPPASSIHPTIDQARGAARGSPRRASTA
ncbi:MAG: hypothetical protein M3401_12510 [Actinomycetota bacterium]|nr:hypothetical protein [Actinomycetota bacterium]